MNKNIKYNKMHLILWMFVALIVLNSLWIEPTPIIATTKSQSPTTVQKNLTLMAVGDLMMHDEQMAAGKTTSGYDFSSFFKFISPTLNKADLVMGNLESTFAGQARGYHGYPRFNAPDEYLTALKAAHFNILTTANNHSLDFGEQGVLRTMQQLDKFDVIHTGSFASEQARSKPVIIKQNQIKIGLLAYTYGTNGIPLPKGKSYLVNLIDKARMQADIARTKEAGADVVVVSIHFGSEYQRMPNAYQKTNVDFLFQAGADIILGSHPHVLQPYEIRKLYNKDGSTRTGVVIYSLGNFVSGQRNDYKDFGGILSIVIAKTNNDVKITNTTFIPTYVNRYFVQGKRVYNILPIGETLQKHNYPPFTSQNYAWLATKYAEIQTHMKKK
jgi:poly-gamma-glutamate synthesis protein (capsule biosynthesis protein)